MGYPKWNTTPTATHIQRAMDFRGVQDFRPEGQSQVKTSGLRAKESQARLQATWPQGAVKQVLFPPPTIERWKVLRRLQSRQLGHQEATATATFAARGLLESNQQIGLRCRGSVGIRHLQPYYAWHVLQVALHFIDEQSSRHQFHQLCYD